ncbi:MAG TPA: di-trans,poly-cis-decaprenylcistransferase [Bryobacteraceae bacterium]|nr:di-trans,poly-cis-decaprenylcistransferase [Bryobacteraceae bacterium]
MTTSTFHCAIIMDGNGRWARARGLPRLAGHRRGADALRRTLEAAPACGIDVLTVYAFSADNWKRPLDEIQGIMQLFRLYLAHETERCVSEGVRVSVIGRRDRLPEGIPQAIQLCEEATRGGGRVHLRIAVDYSSRDMLLEAGRRGAWASREAMEAALGSDVDLLIRTGGEQRLSDFLLWECAYAELIFTPRMWPDFGAADLEAAVASYRARERRFGAAPAAALG